jgi:hypothetical protein
MNHLRLFVFKNKFVCFIILLIFSISHAYGSEHQANSRQVTISAIENEQTHAIAKHILIEAYKHIDYQISFDDLPGKRALEWANNGLTDGDVARIEGTEKKFTNLIPIKIPIIHFQGVVFTKKLNKDITQWNDLKGLRIGVVRGIRYSTIGTEGMEPFFANDMTHLFSILNKGRIEVAVAVLDAGIIEIERNYKNSGIHVIGSPLFSSPLYHFVHKKNNHLVAPLEKILLEMTSSGRIEKLKSQVLNQLKNQ